MIKDSLNYLKQYFSFHYQFIEGKQKQEAMKERRFFNLSIDNLTQGFIGMWGWESLAMGQVLFARLSPITREAYNGLGGHCPIDSVENIDELANAIRFWISQPYLINQESKRIRKWMEKNYHPKKLVERYIEIYRS